MAAYDIQQHFKGLRVDTGRRRGRDPFATGFEDDSEQEAKRRSRQRDRKQNGPNKSQAAPTSIPISEKRPSNAQVPVKTSVLGQLRDSDDEWLDAPKRTDRRPSPAPAQLQSLRVSDGAGRRGLLDKGLQQGKTPRSAVAQAAGQLAYLDDSDDDEALSASSQRADRGPSPAPPRKQPEDLDPSERRASTPKGSRELPKEQSQTRAQPSRHTVASPFAGTKYLEDSDSDEEAVSSRKNSADDSILDTPDPKSPYESNLSPPPKHLEVKRVDKPKQNGSGVSWRAFSASRTEQRNAEIEAIQASLRQRGKSISFGTHAVTDDGKRVPIPVVSDLERRGSGGGSRGRGRRGRRKSPSRRTQDSEPTEDEIKDGGGLGGGTYDPREYKTNPFTGAPSAIQTTETMNELRTQHKTFQTSESTTSRMHDDELRSPVSPTNNSMTDSADSILSKLTVSPQTIPEGKTVEHSIEPILSPTAEITSPLSRNSSTRSMRSSRPARIPTVDGKRQRPQRRSTSNNTSVSPAQAFLSSWTNAEPAPEPKPDDEGQAIGMYNEYIIGRTVSQGGSGVIKEVHTITSNNGRLVRAVKIVRKAIPDKNEPDNEEAQQELEHEVSVWRHLKHEHVLELHDVYVSDFATFCVMDLNVGGTLFDIVCKARASAGDNGGRKGLEPKFAKRYAYQLACALRYLHEDIRVCHRDVKLENCLIDMSVPNAVAEGGNLRVCDFGLADFLHSDSTVEVSPERTGRPPAAEADHPTTSSVIGTLEYASPKGLSVNRKLFETAGDVWAFGVIVYALCTGDLPFRHPMPSKTVELIMQADWDHNALKSAAAGSDAVIELVSGCLERDIDLRLTIGDALRSPWFEGCQDESEQSATGWL